MLLPPYAPELNPVENVWAYLRQPPRHLRPRDLPRDRHAMLRRLEFLRQRYRHRPLNHEARLRQSGQRLRPLV
ncbi:hypothetical protein [Roseovarius sp.]|uniref:hypothetical protein n=1 Tax=Roseovarius sp. TaxID=1486281 RepID=UPI00356A3DD0